MVSSLEEVNVRKLLKSDGLMQGLGDEIFIRGLELFAEAPHLSIEGQAEYSERESKKQSGFHGNTLCRRKDID